MNREILFRGKATGDGQWVYGDLRRYSDCTCICSDVQETFVDTETVGEYTGLTDKNGTKVFEGDLLKIFSWVKGDFLNGGGQKREDIALVEYDSKTGGYRLKVYNDGKYKRISKFTKNHLWAYDAEVIGNKWDNADLLEGKNG